MALFVSHRKRIGVLLLWAFAGFLLIHTFPLHSRWNEKNSDLSADREAIAQKANRSTGSIEKERKEPEKIKKKKLPWLVIGAGVLVAGAVVYLIVVKKPKYKLNVLLGEGVEGFPASGTQILKKGNIVKYAYSVKAGYKKLSVTIDGVPAATSGSITIEKDYMLHAQASEGIDEHFDGITSPFWKPKTPAYWEVSGGFLIGRSPLEPLHWEYNVYAYSLPKSQYTVTVRMRRTSGDSLIANSVGLFTGSTPLTPGRGYLFSYSCDGRFWVSNSRSFDFHTLTGDIGFIGTPASSTAIVRGFNQWNLIRIVRNGDDYAFYINDQQVAAFSDSTHNPRYVALAFGGFKAADPNRLEYDYFTVTWGGTTASFSASPAEYNPALSKSDILRGMSKKK